MSMSEQNKPKKSLGQNFLTSVGAVNKIIETAVEAAEVVPPGGPTSATSNQTILEIGPGRGVLTEALLKKFDKVIAIEKDHELIEPLKIKFTSEISSGRLQIIDGDILDKSIIESLFLDAERHLEAQLPSKRYAIVANIPYYITGQFLRQWLSADNSPKFMVLMLQKEVAERIVAKDAKESILSISVKAYGEPKYVETVKRGSFYPIPNVDSAILKIDKISKNPYLSEVGPPGLKEECFFEILKAGFAHKRKFLIKNLETKFPSKEKVQNAFKNYKTKELKNKFMDINIVPVKILLNNF